MLTEADRCVACGLCLPQCPTYRITMSEADSPRGRIALMSGVASGRIPMNECFALHIDRCLTCRACEAVCPNHVAYGSLINDARTMLAESPSPLLKNESIIRKSWSRVLIENELIAKPNRFDTLRSFLHFYQGSGLQKLLRKYNLLGKTKLALLEAQLPDVDTLRFAPNEKNSIKSWRTIYPATGKVHGEVGLFLGCVARITDTTTLNATIFILNCLGYTVHVPLTQTCCGAVHQHGGDKRTAAYLAKQNAAAFNELNNLQVIITTASGCGTQLTEHCSDLSVKVIDINEFLVTAEGWERLTVAPLPYKVAVHDPCTLRNVLRGEKHPYTLLKLIPGAHVVPLPGNDQCCGAAGTYFLDQPEMSRTLLNDKIAALSNSGAQYLATSNLGCAMYIASVLRGTEPKIKSMHPVTLLARQISMRP